MNKKSKVIGKKNIYMDKCEFDLLKYHIRANEDEVVLLDFIISPGKELHLCLEGCKRKEKCDDR